MGEALIVKGFIPKPTLEEIYTYDFDFSNIYATATGVYTTPVQSTITTFSPPLVSTTAKVTLQSFSVEHARIGSTAEWPDLVSWTGLPESQDISGGSIASFSAQTFKSGIKGMKIVPKISIGTSITVAFAVNLTSEFTSVSQAVYGYFSGAFSIYFVPSM